MSRELRERNTGDILHHFHFPARLQAKKAGFAERGDCELKDKEKKQVCNSVGSSWQSLILLFHINY